MIHWNIQILEIARILYVSTFTHYNPNCTKIQSIKRVCKILYVLFMVAILQIQFLLIHRDVDLRLKIEDGAIIDINWD